MRRGQRTNPGAFPYWRSVLMLSSLVAGLMLFWGALADPRTGEFADPKAAGVGFLVVVLLFPIVIYVDYRTQSKGRMESPVSSRRRRGPAGGTSGFGATGADVAGN